MTIHEARCGTCREVLTIQVDVDLSDITARLGRIEALLATQGA